MPRRMFSPEIVESDAFLDMPGTSQSLYFHLGMYADDDGFVNPKKIMRLSNSSDDDLKVLISKRFVLPFENGVVVIKHWRINNLIRKDWYKETVYLEYKKQLKIKENGSYTECKQLVNSSLTKLTRRLGKVRLGKVNKDILPATLAEPFNFNSLKEKMLSSKDKRMIIISLYWTYRKFEFINQEQYASAIKRELRASGLLKGYPIERIKEVMFWLNGQEWCDWVLETVHKYIDRDLTKINDKNYEIPKRPFIKTQTQY